ncbi:BQ2448_3611 [Microbotryum intermedium]|uniref:BQ2448_3611 protein n=1 Tax=Microbotryum intermedium TaxID=269621 RepID=A0A238FDJ4_9BASI|nr:BQ2448_3611 [Microbotryum intermedium]
MSPTSLANHRSSVTLKSRILLQNAPWHRRFVRRLTSSPSRQRKLAVLLLLLGAWFFLTHLTHHIIPKAPESESGSDVHSSTAASKASATGRDRLVKFVPSQLERNKITLHYHDGGAPQSLVFPPLVIPSFKSPKPCNEWTGSVWSERGPVKTIEVPFGTRLTFVDPSGSNRTIERGLGDECEDRSCEGLRSFTVTQDEVLALRQLGKIGKTIVRLPSMFPSRLEDITLVTQFSVSRLERFTQTLRVWDAPISLTIYLTEPSDADILTTFISNLDGDLQMAWSKLALTLVKPSYASTREALIQRLRYPINELRNHALRLAPTSYLLVLDADFIPSPIMHHHLQVRVPSLMTHPQNAPRSPTQSRQALVISAFALAPSIQAIPKNLSTLHTMLYVTQPASAYLTDSNAGHGPSLPSLLFHSTPFLTHPLQNLVRPPPNGLTRNSYPLYDERFSDQGGDKQSHTALLNGMGWEFRVLRDVWVTHAAKERRKKEDDDGLSVDDWPGKKLMRLLGERGEAEQRKDHEDEQGSHFNLAAQRDQQRYRYFQDYLPELERAFGKSWRWPRGCEATEAIAGVRVGRTASRILFGL